MRGQLVGLVEVRHAALAGVGGRAAELLLGDLLVGDRPDHLGAGDEHVRRAIDHQDEVGDRGRVHRAAGARPHDRRQLRHDAAGQHVAQEDVGVAGERLDALLDPRAARVVEPDHRAADLGREVHHLADLLGVGAGQRAAEHGEVLGEHADRPAVDRAVAGDHAVAEDLLLGHAEVGAAVGDELVELDEAAVVDQRGDPLARGQLAGLVLLVDARLAAGERGLRLHVFEALDRIAGAHRCGVL